MKNDTNQVKRLISEFLGKREPELKKKSYSTYVSKLRIFSIFLEKYPNIGVSEITNEIILDFWKLLVKRNLDKVTCIKYRHVINNFFNWLLDKQYIDENPVFARPINRIDIKILLAEIKKNDPQLYLACLFQFYAAVRPGNELHGLKIKDIDFFDNRIVIIEENAKKHRRTIDMPKKLADVCFEFMINKYNKDFYVFGRFGCPGTKKLGINTLTTRFNKFRDRLNLPSTYKFYSMKHTGGGMLIEAGASIEELRAHMGHTSIESTDHYIRRHFGNRNQRIIHDFPSPE
jgi:integrase